MYELVKVSENAYYIDCPSKIGIVKLGESAVLIDSGNDKDAGKKALKHLDALGLRLSAIYNTHSHADHIGGNNLIFQRTGCDIYAKGAEAAFTSHPILEPAFLYGGYPGSGLRHKFLVADASPAKELCAQSLPEGLSLIELPGHSFDMVGFMTSDGVAFIADALSSSETLDKYGIGVIYDVEAYLCTLEKLKNMNARLFIPSHAAPTDDIAPLAQYNIDRVNEIAERTAELAEGGISFDNLLSRLFRVYSMTMNETQHALVGSTVRSYLSYLIKNGRIGIEFREEMMIFVKN